MFLVLMFRQHYTQDGLTPLHKAVMGKKEAVVSHLLRKCANPHVRDRVRTHKIPCIFLALSFYTLSVYKLYYCLSWVQDGATPLHYAVQVGALQTVKLLIKYKVDVNVADNVSSTCNAQIGFVSYKPWIFLMILFNTGGLDTATSGNSRQKSRYSESFASQWC